MCSPVCAMALLSRLDPWGDDRCVGGVGRGVPVGVGLAGRQAGGVMMMGEYMGEEAAACLSTTTDMRGHVVSAGQQGIGPVPATRLRRHL